MPKKNTDRIHPAGISPAVERLAAKRFSRRETALLPRKGSHAAKGLAIE